MKPEVAVPPASPPDARDTPFESERDQTSQDIEAVLKFHTREEQNFPNVSNRHDPEAAALQQSMSPDSVLAALDERSEPGERLKAGKTAKEDAGGKK